MSLKDPATYAGEFVCSCCSSGWPTCADTRPDGARYTHAETCQKYIDARRRSDVPRMCDACQDELVSELTEEA